MNARRDTGIGARELVRTFESLLSVEGMSSEAEYRVRKLIDRTLPLEDKMFLKTAKGAELMGECREKARVVREHLESGAQDVYVLLTDLEFTYEHLVRKTYEFRVKAG